MLFPAQSAVAPPDLLAEVRPVNDAFLQAPMFPLVWFDRVELPEANRLLLAWSHKVGPICRPMNGDVCHVLANEGKPIAVTVASTLIRERVGGDLHHLTRENTIELSRLCAVRPGICRVALRLWREFVFPGLGFDFAISYKDADLHNGQTYRFDGWARAGYSHSGGADKRSGRLGRNKWIWVWPPAGATATEVAA